MTDQALLSELARAQALFQARTVAAAMGIPQPTTLHETIILEGRALPFRVTFSAPPAAEPPASVPPFAGREGGA